VAKYGASPCTLTTLTSCNFKLHKPRACAGGLGALKM
jgi:hypothetical protein